jgi:rhomboid protease GluP
VRWKLDKLRCTVTASVVQTKGNVSHIAYENRVCPHCHAINAKDARVFSRCEKLLSSRPVQILERVGILYLSWWSVSTLLGIAMVVIYGRLMGHAGGGLDSVISMDTATLFRLGASFAGAYHQGEWWRLLTVVFLHAGLWHLGFNLFALSQLGPFVEEIFGRRRMILFFVFTGIVVSFGSLLLRAAIGIIDGTIPDVSIAIGASGAIMGLMGIMAGWGQQDGTSAGRRARNFSLEWAIYTMVFGWLIGADNGAHGAGFLAGGLIGIFCRPQRLSAEIATPLLAIGSVFSTVVAVGAVVACLLPIPYPLPFPILSIAC